MTKKRTPMTGLDVASRVEAIRAVAADDERAHIAEDKLLEDVLREIARGVDGRLAAALAKAALKAKELEFSRWCA